MNYVMNSARLWTHRFNQTNQKKTKKQKPEWIEGRVQLLQNFKMNENERGKNK